MPCSRAIRVIQRSNIMDMSAVGLWDSGTVARWDVSRCEPNSCTLTQHLLLQTRPCPQCNHHCPTVPPSHRPTVPSSHRPTVPVHRCRLNFTSVPDNFSAPHLVKK